LESADSLKNSIASVPPQSLFSESYNDSPQTPSVTQTPLSVQQTPIIQNNAPILPVSSVNVPQTTQQVQPAQPVVEEDKGRRSRRTPSKLGKFYEYDDAIDKELGEEEALDDDSDDDPSWV
jgi:hypothetical protein